MMRACSQCGSAFNAGHAGDLCPKCRQGQATLQNATPLAPTDSGIRPAIRSFGDYEVIEEIARGAMGVVYKARPEICASLNFRARQISLHCRVVGWRFGVQVAQRRGRVAL